MLKRATIFLGLLLLATSLFAQAPPDRSTPPPVGPAPAVHLPEIQKRALSNGVPVWIVEVHKVPVVQVNLLVSAGASADPAGKFGVANMTSAMLDEGAGSRSSLEIADAVDYLGASLETTSGYDSSAVRLWVPVARLAEALPVMADVALRPTFPPAELERLRQERLTALMQARDDARSIASMAFPRILYGPDARYGVPTFGTPSTVKAFTIDDLRAYYSANYVPSNAALVVVGDVKTDAVLVQLESAFGQWKATTPAASTAAPANKAATAQKPATGKAGAVTRRVFIIDKPGAPQSQIFIGNIGVSRSTPDYVPIEVMNTLLGGSFTSRLNQNLREKHGYTYGAGSGFAMRLQAGPFMANSGVQTEVTANALKEFFNEFAGIRKPVSPEELSRGKNYLAYQFPGEFEATGDISAKLEELLTYKLPENYYSTYVQNIQAVSAADVNRVATKYITPDTFTVVIVGDRKTIEAPVKALNLGPVQVMTVEQALGPGQ